MLASVVTHGNQGRKNEEGAHPLTSYEISDRRVLERIEVGQYVNLHCFQAPIRFDGRVLTGARGFVSVAARLILGIRLRAVYRAMANGREEQCQSSIRVLGIDHAYRGLASGKIRVILQAYSR